MSNDDSATTDNAAKTGNPAITYLKDYRVPAFLIDRTECNQAPGGSLDARPVGKATDVAAQISRSAGFSPSSSVG